MRPVEKYGPGLHFANSQETNESRPHGQAMFLELDVTYEDDTTAVVRVKAFDV